MNEHYEPNTQSAIEEVLVSFEEDKRLPAADEARRLVEGSPLGTAGARTVRNRIPREEAESVVAQWRAQRAAECPVDSTQNDPTDITADDSTGSAISPAPVTVGPSTNLVEVEKLNDLQLNALEHSFFGRPLGEILDFEDESRDRRRQEILTDLTSRIEEVTGTAPAQVFREAAFVTDLGFDSIAAIELGTEIEAMYGIRLGAEDIADLRTVGDVVDFIEEKAWRQGNLCAASRGVRAAITAENLVGFLRGFGTTRIVEIDEADSFDLKVGNDRWIMRIQVRLVLETPEKTTTAKSNCKRLAKDRLKLRRFEALAKDMFDRREYETRTVRLLMEDLTSFPPEMTRKACAVLVEHAEQRDEWYWEVNHPAWRSASPIKWQAAVTTAASHAAAALGKSRHH